MNTFYFIFEVVPEPANPKIAHTSRAAAHLWIVSSDRDAAIEIALRFLQSESWEITEEKKGELITLEQAESLEGDALTNYKAAQQNGLHSNFYYWHRSE